MAEECHAAGPSVSQKGWRLVKAARKTRLIERRLTQIVVMKMLDSHLNKLTVDVIRTATSKQELKQLLHTSFYSNALYLMIARAIDPLLGFVFWAVAARFYTSTDIGLASAAISGVSMLAMIANLGLGYGLIRFLPNHNKDANSLINTCFSLSGLASLVAALIFLTGLDFWSPALLFMRESPISLIAFVLFATVTTLSGLVDQAFIAKRRAVFALAKSTICNLLRLPLVIVMATQFLSFGIFNSCSLSLLISLLVSIILFLPAAQPGYRISLTINRRVLDETLRFSFGNYLSVVFWNTPGLVFPLIIVDLLGAEFTAYFYIAWAIGSVLSMIPTATSTSLFAEGSYTEATLEINVWRSLKMHLLLLVPALALILAFADKILLIFGIQYVENGTNLLRILAITNLPLAINSTYLTVCRVAKNLKVIVGLSVSVMVVTLVLAYLLLPLMGISGAGIACLASQTVAASAVVLYWLKKKQIRTVDR